MPAIIFDEPADFMAALFGAPQHDAHVIRRRHALWLAERNQWLDEADLRVKAAAAEIIGRMRAERMGV